MITCTDKDETGYAIADAVSISELDTAIATDKDTVSEVVSDVSKSSNCRNSCRYICFSTLLHRTNTSVNMSIKC